MKLILKFTAVFALSFLGYTAFSQVRNVTGTVSSAQTGQPVAEVVIRIKGSLAAVYSDEQGKYAIAVPENSSLILTFSHLDFDYKEESLGGRNQMDVSLNSNVRFNQYGVQVNRTPLTAEEREGILVFESIDQEYKMWLDIRIQADAARFFGDVLNPIGNGIAMRRVRIAYKAELSRKWEAEFDMDFGDGTADLKDAYLKYVIRPGFDFRAGNFKERFSIENNTSSRWLPFMERPNVTNALAPSRHIGVQGTWEMPYLLLVGGVHFQKVGDSEVVTNRQDNNWNGHNEGISYTGKVTFNPFYHDLNRGLHLGIAGSWRTPKLDDRTDNVRFDTRSLSNINRKKYFDTDRIDKVDHYILNNFEVAAYYHNYRFQAEYTTARVYRKEDLETEQFYGFYLMGTVMLFGGKQFYNTYQGEFTQPNTGRSWGDVELALRYDLLDLNSWTEGVMGGAGEGFTLGLSYYAPKNVKLMLNYSVINHDRWANQRGRLFAGTDMDGKLTRDPKLVTEPTGEGGENFSFLAFRIQVAF